MSKYLVFMTVVTRTGFSKVVEANSLEEAISQTSQKLDNMDREDDVYERDGWEPSDSYNLFECPVVLENCCYKIKEEHEKEIS